MTSVRFSGSKVVEGEGVLVDVLWEAPEQLGGPVGVILEEIELDLLVLDLQLSLHLAVLDAVPYHDDQDGDGGEYGGHHVLVGGCLGGLGFIMREGDLGVLGAQCSKGHSDKRGKLHLDGAKPASRVVPTSSSFSSSWEVRAVSPL